MGTQSGRDYLEEHLTPQLPGKWKIIPYDTNVDPGLEPVMMYRIQSLAKHPAAPSSTFLGTWILTIIAPEQDPQKADDHLDDLVMDALAALSGARIKWDTAEKAKWGDHNLCYDITIQLATSR